MSEPLGAVLYHGFGNANHERRTRLEAIAYCPECDSEVECWSESEMWAMCADGKWHHHVYGVAQGVCWRCSLLLVHPFDGCTVYRTKEAQPS